VAVVGLAWVLASKQDGNNYDKLVEDYLNRIINENCKNRPAILNTLLPRLYAVSAKIATQRIRAFDSFKRIDELKENRLKHIEQISELGSSAKGIFSRIIGITAGGAAGAIAAAYNSTKPITAVNPEILLGIAAGYGAVELLLWCYKLTETNRTIKFYSNEKKKIWDGEFTSETHLASIKLYAEALDLIKQYYSSSKIKVRDKARDFQKMTQLFMERPILEKGSISILTEFFDDTFIIEDKIRKFVSEYFRLEFKYFSEKQNKYKGKDASSNPKKRGLKVLSDFLKDITIENKPFIDDTLHNCIEEIRDKRKEIINYANYNDLEYCKCLAEETRKNIELKIRDTEKALSHKRKNGQKQIV
jgi:hypothetical protein